MYLLLILNLMYLSAALYSRQLPKANEDRLGMLAIP